MVLENFNPLIPNQEDGFALSSPSLYHAQKSRIFAHHFQLFANTMQRKFDYLVYVDLQAGSGLLQMIDGGVDFGPEVLALETNPSFSKFVFSANNNDEAAALKVRINKYYRHSNAVVFQANPNEVLERLTYYIPDSSERHKVSVLCKLDLTDLSIEFETVRILSEMGVNFIVTISPDHLFDMDYEDIITHEHERLRDFLGKSWEELDPGLSVSDNETFFLRLVKTYHQQLRELGYISKGSFVETESGPVRKFFSGYYYHPGDTKVPKEMLEAIKAQRTLFN